MAQLQTEQSLIKRPGGRSRQCPAGVATPASDGCEPVICPRGFMEPFDGCQANAADGNAINHDRPIPTLLGENQLMDDEVFGLLDGCQRLAAKLRH